MKTLVEIGVMLPNSKEYLGPPEPERGQKDFFQEPSGGIETCQHLDLQAHRMVREYISVLLSH